MRPICYVAFFLSISLLALNRASAQDTAALEQWLRARVDRDLAPYKRPRLYRFLDAIPRNAMGKVERSKLREL